MQKGKQRFTEEDLKAMRSEIGRRAGLNSRKNISPERATEIARANVAKRKDRQK